jgi:hypothetical protein
MFLGVLASLRTDCNRSVLLNARSNYTDKSVLIKFYSGELYYNFSNPFSFSFSSRSFNDPYTRRLIRVSANSLSLTHQYISGRKIFWTKVTSEKNERTNGFLWPIHFFAVSDEVLEIILQEGTNVPELLAHVYVSERQYSQISCGSPDKCEEYRSLVFIYSSHDFSWDVFVV